MGKIEDRHLRRKACIYVRQSSMTQVLQHRESTERQYNLRARAVQLGWSQEQVDVIDEDQGQSGASAQSRTGFQRLVAEVALGEVGAVFGLEVSRLARSCADWYRLLEVAALTRTLIVDEDGVYNPNHYNDRLLLGLKGTMSEAELHFLKSRMVGGRNNKARKGEYRIRLPVGYVWDQGVILDPDERVRESVHMLFRCFERIGTAAATARYFEDHKQLYPRRDGYGGVDTAVTWGPLSVSRIITMLRNPVYAGVYVYNRHSAKAYDPEEPGGGGLVWIPGAHPAYITLEQYEKNISRLTANRSIFGGMRNRGSAREGRSLLHGLVLCGRCGRHMNVLYSKNRIAYSCRSTGTRRICQEVNVRHVEPLVEQIVLESVCGEELELGLAALDKLNERYSELDAQWRKRIEAAVYEAEKAARRYYRVEPENRLVARTLESEWNSRLEEVEGLKAEYEEVKKKPPFQLSDEQRELILAMAQDLPRLWRAPTTRQSQRKQVIRILIEDITLENIDEPRSIAVAIRWKTGIVTRHTAKRVVRHAWKTSPEVVARIEELFHDKMDKEIAEILNVEGYRTGYGKAFTASSVCHIRSRRDLMKKPMGRTSRGSEFGKVH